MRLSLLSCFLPLGLGLDLDHLSRTSTDFCSWSPLQQLLDDSSCRLTAQKDRLPKVESSKTNGSNSNQTAWDGPRHCLGKYCVWSNRKFAGGIAVVTTRENARRIAEISDIASIDSDSALPQSFHATDVPGKGVGLVANRTIRRGERIMAWQPTFLMHHSLVQELDQEAQHRVLDAALYKLPSARRRAFTRQLGQFGGHQVSDIMATNSFQMDVGGKDGRHLANFPDVSRFNHDCRPNVAFRIDDQLTHYTHAVRDIAAGEELTITYMNPFEPWAERQSHIEKSWGFVCTCKHCSMSESEIEKSDARLVEIEELETELGDFSSKKVSTAMIEKLLKLYETERLHAKCHGAYVLAALNYNLFGNAKKAKKYATLAVETGIVEFGPDAGDVKAMRSLAENPRQHWSWRMRVGG